jgi:hypothetical protein
VKKLDSVVVKGGSRIPYLDNSVVAAAYKELPVFGPAQRIDTAIMARRSSEKL